MVGAEALLAKRGREFGPVRVAVGRSGIAVGFPKDPMIHVSWWALAGLAAVSGVWLRISRRRRANS